MYNEICHFNSIQHVVEAGDTFWRLSQAYGVSLQNIVDANPGVNPQNLQIGSILCIPTVQTTPTLPTTPSNPVFCPEGAFSYTVQDGDTFWRLSQAYGVSLQSIVDANPGVNPQNLQIGSTLCIPTALATPALPTTPTMPVFCPKGAFSYTVQDGDTFWRLSQAYGVSLQSIVDANSGVDPQNLQIGSTLCIPTALATPTLPTMPSMPVFCPEGAFSYTVQAGDTLWWLSRTYDVSVQSIIDANPGVNANSLQIGSILCIPTVQTSPVPPTTPTMPVFCQEGAFPYTVQDGDTLWWLSQTYDVSVQSIIDANPGVNANSLQVGSTLCIPTVQTMPASPTTPTRPVFCPEGAFPYIVQDGDTLWWLSQTYDVSVQNIIDANPGVNPQNLLIGSTLCIPTVQTPPVPPTTPTPPAPPSYFAYLIKRCDTICGIARKFYVSVESILQINPEIDPKCLQTGTYIYVPINCCESNTCRYTVRAGDTLNSIANKFNICPLSLIEANPNIDFQHLVRCQIICIPNA